MNRKLFLLLALLCVMVSCSKDDGDDRNNPALPDSQEVDSTQIIKDSLDFVKSRLCFAGKFVERKVERETFDKIYECNVTVAQNDFTFNQDGTGQLEVYNMIRQAKGFNKSTYKFTWKLSDRLPVSISIVVDGGESIRMNNVEVTDRALFSDEKAMTRELKFISSDETPISKDSIISYSISDLHTLQGYNSEYGEYCVYFTPSLLTINTTSGIYRFIRQEYATVAYGFSFWIENDKKEYIYFCIDNNDIFYNLDPYMQMVDYESKSDVSSKKSKYNIYVGYVMRQYGDDNYRYRPYMIDNDREYKIEN